MRNFDGEGSSGNDLFDPSGGAMRDDTTNCPCGCLTLGRYRGTRHAVALLIGMIGAAPAAYAAISAVGVSGGVGVFHAGSVGLTGPGTVSQATDLGVASATAETTPLPRVATSVSSTLPSFAWNNGNETNAAASMGYSVLVPGTSNMNFDLLVTASGSVSRGGTGAGGGSFYSASDARFSIFVVGTNALIVEREVCVGYSSSPVQPSTASCNALATSDAFSLNAYRFTVKGNTEIRLGLSTIVAATDNGTASAAAAQPWIQIAPDSPYAAQYSLQFSPGVSQSPAVAVNYQALWWNPNESGWGINFAHQGDIIFATWFTYDAAGKPWWLIAELHKSAAGTYTGPVSTVAGPPFNAVPFAPAPVETQVGTMTATFSDATHGSLAYTVNGIAQTKAIVPQQFGPLPTCAWGGQTNLEAATNYTDLWWNAGESGWGINFTHQGDVIFATWFTYDAAGKPWWLIAELHKGAGSAYTGPVSTVSGQAFNTVPWIAGNVVETPVGTATATFANGNSATFAYTVNGVSQSKPIARQVFAPPGTVCR
jgi:hypothetical protein